MGPLIVILFYVLPSTGFLLLSLAIVALAVLELAGMSGSPDRILILPLCLSTIIPLYLERFQGYPAWVLMVAALYSVSKIAAQKQSGEDVNRQIVRGITVLLAGAVFLVLPFYYLWLLKARGDYLPVLLLLAIWASDTGAYFLGKSMGKRALVPFISPKKTYAGLLGAVLGSALLFLVAGGRAGLTVSEACLAGACLGLTGQLGDILESAAKRLCGVKDSSGLIPGHGGILDRIDSFIFSAPFFYHYVAGIR